jgi:aerobic carbon-monoxide dehydrogenase small subunit
MESDLLRYELQVNGATREVADAWLGESLLFVLRERLGLPGAKNACEQGECGSCSVLVDGSLVCACLVLAASLGDAQITTVEGIAAASSFGDAPGEHGDRGESTALSTVQQAFVDAGAIQCGFCTPGLVMAVHDLIDRTPNPTDLEAREAISGNLCRCTGYGRVLEAIRLAVLASAPDNAPTDSTAAI